MNAAAAQDWIDSLEAGENSPTVGPDEDTTSGPKNSMGRQTETKQSPVTSQGGSVGWMPTASPETPTNQGSRVG